MRLRPEIATTDTDDGVVMLDERSGRYWQLNRTATLMLHALLRGAPPERIAEDLATRHHIDRQRVEHDIGALIDHLHNAKLVTPS